MLKLPSRRAMENKENPNYLNFQRLLNTLLGVPLYTSSCKQFGPKFEFLLKLACQRFGEITVILVTIGQLCAIPYVSEDINVLCGCVSSSSHCLQLVAKTALLIIQKKRYEMHLKKTHELQKETLAFKILLDQEYPDFDNFQKHKSRYINIILVIQLTVNFCSTSAYFLPFIYDSVINRHELQRQMTPIVIYLGKDFHFTPLFQIIIIILTLGFFITNLKTVVVDGFILNIIILHISQLKYHNNLLKKIIFDWDLGLDVDYKETITVWIRQHQNYLNLYENFKKLVCPYLLFEFSYVVIHTCVPAFVITSTFSWTPLQKMAVFLMIGGALITLFLMCNAGDVFCAELDYSKNLLFSFELAFKEEKYMKNCYLLIQQRLQKPFRLSAFNVIPLNCATFLNILKLIFSHYMTLNQLQKIKHIG